MQKLARKRVYEKDDIVIVQFPEKAKRTMWGKLGEEKLDSPIIAKVKSKKRKSSNLKDTHLYFFTLPLEESKYSKQDLSFYKELFARVPAKHEEILGLFNAKNTLKDLMDV